MYNVPQVYLIMKPLFAKENLGTLKNAVPSTSKIIILMF